MWQAVVEFFKRNWKWILVVIIILIVYAAIKRNWYSVKFWFQPRDVDVLPGEEVNLTPQQEVNLKDLARRLYTDIYDTPYSGHDYSIYEETLQLTDSQLLYLARYYRKNLTHGITLYDDINNELFVFTDLHTQLKARLSKIGEGTKGDSRIRAEARATEKRSRAVQ